jgi:hypothetical protein
MNLGLGFHIVQLELAEEAMERARLERQIREVKRATAARRSQLGGGLIEQRPGPGRPHFARKIDFEEAMKRLEASGNSRTAARLRLARPAG